MRFGALMLFVAVGVLTPVLRAQSIGGRVTVLVTSPPGDSGRPVEDAAVRVGVHSVETNARGAAHLELQAGTYAATVTKIGFTPDTIPFRNQR